MGSIDITLETSSEATRSLFREVRTRQLPFAIAVALTESGVAVAKDSGSAIGDHFTIKSKGMRKLLTSTRANKRDHPNQKAIVHLRRKLEFMADHVGGADRKPEKGAKRMAVPTDLVKRTSTGKVRKNVKPRMIRNRRGGTVAEFGGTKVIHVRRLKRMRKRPSIFYTLHPKVKIKDDWPVEEDASASFGIHYQTLFPQHLRAAIKSARAQPGRFTTTEGRTFWLKALRKVRAGG